MTSDEIDRRKQTIGPSHPHQDVAQTLTCPWCGSPEVERIAAFGPQLMSEQYYCRQCRSPFERIRK